MTSIRVCRYSGIIEGLGIKKEMYRDSISEVYEVMKRNSSKFGVLHGVRSSVELNYGEAPFPSYDKYSTNHVCNDGYNIV